MDDASASLGLFLFFLLAAKILILLNFPSQVVHRPSEFFHVCAAR